ncbi:MAG: DNA internalization-related competence protein ComEC/Rec2 [Tatlockia sp.]|nr:DNA internalization-related competence protein ComEC/Rec2 [Tatlockia sp.]
MEILCFYAGIAFVYTKSVYPFLLIAISLFFKPKRSFIFWFLAALIYGFAHQYWIQDRGMPEDRVLANVRLEGSIVSIPNASLTKTQFQFHANRLNDKAVDATILLACYQHCPLFKAGQIWRLDVKLKKPENLANPGSFDFVSSLKGRHINWTGYIRHGSVKLSETATNQHSFLVLREKLALTMEQALPNSPSLGILQALTLNVTSHIDKDQWDLFRRTGTTHLMVISGSHIGLIAGFCYWLMKWLWSRSSRLCLYCPAIKIASVAGLLSALVYALLAGFEPPSQRSLIACFFLLLSNFLSQRFTVWQAWRYGLFLVLLFEPHAVLLPGFYLSFIAVAILIMINLRIVGGTIKKAICIQLACLFGLMPLSLYWFSYGAINGLIANLIAIPVVGFVIVPLALINLILLQGFGIPILVVPIKISIAALLYYLQWIDSFAMINLNVSYAGLLVPLALMLAMVAILFIPIKAIYPAVSILILAAIFPAYKRVAAGDVRVDVLDVGQGLAVVVQTAKHVLVYDTGMKFYQGGDMGKLAIIPYLNTLGIHKLDKVIISHPDLDHRGGLPSLEEKYPISELLVDKVAFYRRGKDCHQYPPWVWDGVSFQFLAINEKFRDKNNSSCVLKIENEAGRVLLTGDIEKKAEDYLVKTYGKQLKVDVLLVPHHGSKTSSSYEFIKEISPIYAIISLGFDNRYHFPHKQTLATLGRQKIAVYSTAECGMVTIELFKKNNLYKPLCYKQNQVSG